MGIWTSDMQEPRWTTRARPATAEDFVLQDSNGILRTSGIGAPVARGPIDTLAARTERLFRTRPGGPRLVVGAIPFDRAEDDFLFQPRDIVTGAPRVEGASAIGRPARATIRAIPSVAAFRTAVQTVLHRLDDSAGDAVPLSKVVLARGLELISTRTLDVPALLAALAVDPAVSVFLAPLPAAADGPRPVLIGATPELLVKKVGDRVISWPLAGSARRHEDDATDEAAAQALSRSAKDRREHQMVIDAILDALRPHCRDLATPDGTVLRATASMWHLGTRIVGRLKSAATPVTELVAALHPTPAVCGLPRIPAARLISEIEGHGRGFYAGAVGWADESGDGEWHVAIRSAVIAGRRALLHAGAGIVTGSDPAQEADETSAKFAALLAALGVDDEGRPLQEHAA